MRRVGEQEAEQRRRDRPACPCATRYSWRALPARLPATRSAPCRAIRRLRFGNGAIARARVRPARPARPAPSELPQPHSPSPLDPSSRSIPHKPPKRQSVDTRRRVDRAPVSRDRRGDHSTGSAARLNTQSSVSVPADRSNASRLVGHCEHRHVARHQRRAGVPQRDQPARQVEQRRRVAVLPVDRQREMIRRRSAATASRSLKPAWSGHRRATASACARRRATRSAASWRSPRDPAASSNGISTCGQAELLALIEEDVAAQAQRAAASSSARRRRDARGAAQRETARGASWFSNAQLGQPVPGTSGHLPSASRDERGGQRGGVEEVEAIGAVEPPVAAR